MVIECVEYHVRLCVCGTLRSGGWGWVGVRGCLFPGRFPGPADPIPASPAPVTPCGSLRHWPCRGTLIDHLLRDASPEAIGGPSDAHLPVSGRVPTPPYFSRPTGLLTRCQAVP